MLKEKTLKTINDHFEDKC